jgi:signal transduction histidine kinase/ligand-binding sensor domain-containing protein
MLIAREKQPSLPVFGALMIFACVLACPLISKAEHLPIKTYTVADGLLRDTVFNIKQDSRGFIWFCTEEGVSRFDGVGMRNFTVADGLPDRSVGDFLETRTGTIYIATGKGLARLNPDGLRGSTENPLFTVFLPDNPKAEKILTLFEDTNDQIWVGTSDGLYQLIEAGNGITLEHKELGMPLPGFGDAIFAPIPNTLYVDSILEDRQGTLWIGTFGSGLFRMASDGSVRRFTSPNDGFGDNKITALLEDRDGRIWMGLRSDEEGGVCQLDATDTAKPVRKCYRTKDGLPVNRIRDMAETSDGQVWLATSRGLCRWQGGGGPVCKTYTAKNDLCDEVYVLTEDKDGNLWTGSECGAKKIARYGFTTYTAADGLDSNRTSSIFENSTSELFATTFPNGGLTVSRFDGSKFSSVKLRLPAYVNYFGWAWQQTIWQDSHGAWWVPTGVGLFRSLDNTGFEKLAQASFEKINTGAKGEKVETGAKVLEIFRLFEDSRGDVWIATTGFANELMRWERAKNIWHDYSEQTGTSSYRVGTAFAEDGQGNIWIGASSDHGETALIRYRDGEFRVLSQADGGPSGEILDLFLDSRGRLWIASTNDGLWRLDKPDSDDFEFIKYGSDNGLTSTSTATITGDEFGRIYIGTWRGIDRLDPDTGQVENFTTADGLSNSDIEVSYSDKNNDLWFGATNGLARFVPEPPRKRSPPNILITGLRVNGESQSVSVLGENTISSLKLNSDQKQVSVDFVGLGASLGEKLKYEYRLGTSEWSPTEERTINFASFASGDSQIEIRAITGDRLYSPPAIISLHIDAPVWQRPWFMTALLAMIILMIYVFYRFRLSRLLEVANIRTRIATDLHDDIGANLTKIAILSEVAQRRFEPDSNSQVNGRDNLLSSVAEISRESVSSMGDIVWAINPKKDSLIGLTRRMRQYAEEILERRDILLEFNAPVVEPDPKLGANLRRDLYLIFKEAVNNIVRHSKATNVTIDFSLVGKELVLRIADNGVGFDATDECDGNGLLNIRKRALDRGGELEINSMQGTGTRITLKVKLRSVAWSWK